MGGLIAEQICTRASAPRSQSRRGKQAGGMRTGDGMRKRRWIISRRADMKGTARTSNRLAPPSVSGDGARSDENAGRDDERGDWNDDITIGVPWQGQGE